MIRMKFTFLVFQGGQPDEQLQTIVEFEDAKELAEEMARLAAHNSLVSAHPAVRDMASPTKILAAMRPRKSQASGTVILIQHVDDLTRDRIPPEIAHDPELVFHAAMARAHRSRSREPIN
ncbi:hypothetical protein HY631_05035 [Candidatus Uhrbacteria bacterium]|nr:hypothetical protein [Candidatus Uhrbacteria bacterium]